MKLKNLRNSIILGATLLSLSCAPQSSSTYINGAYNDQQNRFMKIYYQSDPTIVILIKDTKTGECFIEGSGYSPVPVNKEECE